MMGLKDYASTHSILVGTALALSASLLYRKLRAYLLTRKYRYPVEVEIKDRTLFGTANLDYFNKNYEKCIMEWLQKHPDECTLNLGKMFFDSTDTKIVVLNSIEAVQQFSENDGIANRPNIFLFDVLSHHFLGSFFRLYDKNLLEVRKTTALGLQRLVLSNPDAEQLVFDELGQMIDFLNKEFVDTANTVDDFRTYVQQAAVNVLLNVGLNVRFDFEKSQNAEIKQQIHRMSEIFTALNILSMSKITSGNHKWCYSDTIKYLSERLTPIYKFVTDAVVGYKSGYDPNFIRTFADLLISKQEEQIKLLKELKKDDAFSDNDIIVQVFTVFMAGVVTTGFTLSWSFYYLSKYPELQEKIYSEIKLVCGETPLISWKKRPELKYTEAFIMEVLRLSSTQPFIGRGTVNELSVTTQNGEYLLPANTTVLINAYAIHHNPTYWPEPNACKPERWFGTDGNLVPQNERYIPFGTAPRTCSGDTLSKLLLFSIVSNMVNRYKFEYVPLKNDKTNSNLGYLGYMRCPFEYNLNISKRN